MVFRTLNSDASGLSNKIGILSHSFNELFANINTNLSTATTKNGKFKAVFTGIGQTYQKVEQPVANASKGINAYNSLLEKGVDVQSKFNNVQNPNSMVRYFQSLKGGKATMEGYTASLKSATLGQKALTTATKIGVTTLNMLGNMAIAAGISLIITGLTNLVNRQKELRESISEAAQEAKKQTDKLNDLVSTYEEFADKVTYTTEEKEKLKSIQEQLVEAYHTEVGEIDLANGRYDEQIEKLRQLKKEKLEDAELSLIAEREQAKRDSDNGTGKDIRFKISSKHFRTEDDYNKIAQSLKELWTKSSNYAFSDNISLIDEALGFDGELHFFSGNSKQRVEEIKEVMNVLKEYGYTNLILYSKLNDLLKEHQSFVDTENTAVSNLAENKFQQFELNNPFEKVNGKDAYIAWKNSLLETAKGDTDLQNELSNLAEKQFPDYQKYFDNIAELKAKYVDTTADVSKAISKMEFINLLSDEELEIATQIPNLFKDGLDGARKAIDDFKETHPTIGVDTDTSGLQDLSTEIENTSKETKLMKTAMEEMADTGYISASTYAEITEMGGNFADCLEVQNGRLVLNIEKLKELKKAEYDLEIQTKSLAIAETEHNIALAAQGGNAEEVKRLTEELTRLRQEKAALITAQDEFINTKSDDKKSSSSSDPIKEALDQKRKELDHLFALNEITKKELYDTLFGSKEYQDLLTNEKKYQSEIWDLQEEYYKWQNEQEDKLFDKKIDNYDKLKDKALEDNDFDNARSQVNGKISATQSRISELKSSGKVGVDDELEELYEQLESLHKEIDEIDNKEIDFRTDKLDDVLDDLDEYAEKLDETFTTSDGTKLTSQEKWQAIVDVYKEAQVHIQEEIDRILDMGIEGHEEQVKQLEEKIEDYGNKISDAFKSAVEEEKDYWENVKDSVSNSYDERIDKIKEQQSAAEKAADAEIDALQDKIDALNKANEAKEEEINLEQLKHKAELKTRMTYGADGTVTYKQDPEAKQEYEKALLEHQINILKNQKDSLEKSKNIQSKGFDSMIEDLEAQKEQDERQFDILIQRLDDYLNPDSSTSNSDVWSELAKMDGASYRNGKWVDKNGNTIDINALVKKSEQLNGDSGDSKVNKTDSGDSKTDKTDSTVNKADNISKSTTFDKFAENAEKIFGVPLEKSLAAWNKFAEIMPTFNPVQEMLRKTTESITNTSNTVNHNDSVANFNIGDIVVNNPVGDAKQLANEVKNNIVKQFMMEIPNDAMKIIYSNLK